MRGACQRGATPACDVAMNDLMRYLATMQERYGIRPRRLNEYRQQRQAQPSKRERDLAASMARHPSGKRRREQQQRDE